MLVKFNMVKGGQPTKRNKREGAGRTRCGPPGDCDPLSLRPEVLTIKGYTKCAIHHRAEAHVSFPAGSDIAKSANHYSTFSIIF